MTMPNDFIPVSPGMWRAYKLAYFEVNKNVALLHSAGWRSGFIVNGFRP